VYTSLINEGREQRDIWATFGRGVNRYCYIATTPP